MSVRRTVAQSSAGLLLLAAFAAGPTAVYAAPDASDGGGDPPEQSECPPDAVPQAFVSPSSPKVGEAVTITGQCFPERGALKLDVIGPDDAPKPVDLSTDGFGSVSGTFPPEVGGEHRFIFTYEETGAQPADGSFMVEGAPDGGGTEEGDEGEEEGSDENQGGSGDSSDESEDSEESGDDEQGNEDSDSSDDGQEQDGDGQDSAEDSQDQGDDQVGNGGDSDAGTGDSDSDDEQKQDNENSNGSGSTEGSEEEQQQGGDTTASGSPTQHFPGDEQDGDTSASAANDNASSTGNGPAQPPAAPGSATNDFPAARQEATADQKQSAALAVLMTKLFAGGVSSGSVGTTPDQARTVIDPSADASEIEVPAGSDTGGSSDSGSGSESSDGDALAATGSNMLVPAGIAAAAILLGAGLRIGRAHV